MSAPLDPANVDHAIELYLDGKPIGEIAATTGVSPTSLRRIRSSRGIPSRSGPTQLTGVVRDYLAGESEYALAMKHGVSRNVVRRHLIEAKVTPRGRSEAGRVRVDRMSPEQRRKQSAAAHTAARGMKHSHESLVIRARKREALGTVGSAGEQMVVDAFARAGEQPVTQCAIDKYNVDVAVPPVAVEVLGGGWHLEKRHHAQRTPTILNQGWAMLFIWNHEGSSALTEYGAQYAVAFLNEVRGNPSIIGEYRVIAGNGKLLTAGRADDNQFPLVPPPRGRC